MIYVNIYIYNIYIYVSRERERELGCQFFLWHFFVFDASIDFHPFAERLAGSRLSLQGLEENEPDSSESWLGVGLAMGEIPGNVECICKVSKNR